MTANKGNKVFRRLSLIWCVALITWTVWYVFTREPTIAAGTASALLGVVGLLGVIVGFYHKNREADDRRTDVLYARGKDDLDNS